MMQKFPTFIISGIEVRKDQFDLFDIIEFLHQTSDPRTVLSRHKLFLRDYLYGLVKEMEDVKLLEYESHLLALIKCVLEEFNEYAKQAKTIRTEFHFADVWSLISSCRMLPRLAPSDSVLTIRCPRCSLSSQCELYKACLELKDSKDS